MLLRATLRDPQLEASLNRDGFVYIPGLVDAKELEHMLALYRRHYTKNELQKGMWNSLYDINGDEGKAISEELLGILRPKFEVLFSTYHTPVATFMSKNPNPSSITDLHRDFSILDEERFQYRNIWIPMVDTNEHNGALYAVRGSHRVFTYPLPLFQKWPYRYMLDDIFPLKEVIAAKAGDCVIYTDKTLHGSFINQTSDSRPVVHLGAHHPSYELLYYFYDEQNNEVRTYEVPADFYFRNDFSEPKDRYKLHSSFQYNPPKLDAATVVQDLKTLWQESPTAI